MKILKYKKLLILAAACLAALFTVNAALAAADNWGLSFQEAGQTPKGNVSQEELKKYDAMYVGDTSKKTIYLTFDAGYENGHTAAILDTLKKHEVSATFFVVGHYITSAPELIKRMCDEGHIVGNHSYHHPDMSSVDLETFQKELESLETLYKSTTGQDMARLYRPPQGKYSKYNLEQAKQLGYKTVFWSLAYADWMQDKQPSKQQAFDKLLPRTHPGAIVLLHSTSKTNAEILDELLTKWKDEGYSFGKLDEI